MNINLLAFSIIFTFSIQCSCQNPESIIISTNYGKLRGFVHILADSKQKIDIFFGIPFVHPPLGNLRFEKPLPPASWKEVRDAGEESKPSACVPHGRPIGGSTSSKFSEDCLYLNIFAPHKTNENNADALPILLLIHGGAYEIGSSARYSDYEKMGSRFVAKGVILVSIQYRLGVYGFASTGNNEMPGNLGIWDQIAALRWIKENIGAFGGDPLRVTVLGYSAGSGSTGLLSTTPAAKDLFHQTVRMSGSVLGNSGSGTFVPKNTMELAKAMNCSAANSFLKKCFKQKSVEEIFDGIEQIGAAPISYAIAKFSPYRMDKELFEIDHPEAIAKSPPKRTMLGFTELDFLLMTLIMDRNSSVSMLALTDEDVQNYGQPHFEAFLRNFVAKNEYFGEQIGQQIRAELFDFYVNKYEHKEEKDKDAEFYLRLYSMVCSDLMMVVPLLWESQMRIAANWPMYLYEFKYINPEVFPKRVKVHVAYHDYDHDLIFRDELTKNEDDKRIAAFLIESIVNFVKSGDPSSEAIEWKTTGNFSLTDSKSISHMEIGINPKQKEGMEGEIRRLHFWMQIRQKYRDKFDLVRGIYGNTATTSINAAGLFWPIVAIIISLTIMHFVG